MGKPPKTELVKTTLAIVFWLAVWQLASKAIGEELYLPSPMAVFRALGSLALTGQFWLAAFTSLGRIAAGFFLGLVTGLVLGSLAAVYKTLGILLRPLLLLVRATPVASFIILALVWVSSKNLSVFISFLMVLPVIYTATLTGLQGADKKLLEMAQVFRVGFWRSLRAIYLPALLPGLLAACELGLGLCWKSGIAAEVIGLPQNTIGERLYQAKIFLQMPELFAYTAVIVFLSWGFGKLVWALLNKAGRRLERGPRI